MLHFTNQELATTHHVSVRTVRNWIESAKAGKLDLSMITKGERTYIANTSKNSLIIKDLVEKGKKFRPHRAQKTVSPQAKFYSLYTQEQLFDLVSNLEINHEIPNQYNYFGDGADNWDHYVQHLADEESSNSLRSTIDLLSKNRDYLDDLTARYTQINVIDVGVGNGLPVRPLLTHLIEQEKLGRYIALDISTAMLDIAGKNIKEWFGDKVNFEAHAVDIDHDRFGNLLVDEYIKSDSDTTTNIILFLGGTIANFRNPRTVLKVIHDSMGVKDLLVISQKLDTPSTRSYFDFNPTTPSSATLAPIDRHIFELLNIDESLYEVDMGFDADQGERFIRVILKIALSIRFKFTGGERIVHFDKGDTILLWRARRNNVLDIVKQLTESELYPLQVSQAEKQDYVLTISRIKHD